MGYKIGLGITTVPSRKVHESIVTMTSPDTLIHVHTDVERIGVARSRNNVIKYLYDKGCENVVILDDDVQILFKGWEDYILNNKGKENMLGLPSNFNSKILGTKGEVVYWDGLLGAFHFFTRHFIEKVGYFSKKFGVYATEDVEMQNRAKWSGLISKTGLPSLMRLPFYFMSEDVYHLNPTPTLSKEEKQEWIARSQPVLEESLKTKNIYLPYEQS